RSLTIVALGPVPLRRRTSLPPWKSTNVGTERMPSEDAGAWASSTSHFTTLTLPFMSPAISSATGARTLQGPHHVAWKSTSTGIVDLATSVSHVCSVTSPTLLIRQSPWGARLLSLMFLPYVPQYLRKPFRSIS